jgi:putative transposase
MEKEIKSKEELRLRAMDLYNNNWSVTRICKTLDCSRNWFYKWKKRYAMKDPGWYKEHSREPKNKLRRRNEDVESLIIETRKELISKPYMQYGPQAIFYILEQKEIKPPPVWTIARVIKRNGLSNTRRKKPYISKGKKYPYEYLLCQQMDFIGPRYLYSKARFYFHSIICCDTHYSQVTINENQNSKNVCDSLVKYWKTLGIPDYLQMDNDLSFWGSLNKPSALGKVIRLCLEHRVTPIFIPQSEPWRNGVIEHFNKTVQNAVLNSSRYDNIQQLREATEEFCESHNQNHHYSTQEGMTPIKRLEYLKNPYTKLDENYSLPEKPLQLEDGEIHIIRFIRSDLKFHLFGLSFALPEDTIYEYVKGVIRSKDHRLIIYQDQEYVTEFNFKLY